MASESFAMVQPRQWLMHGGAAHRVLRLVGNEQITADKAAELLVAILQGRIAIGDLPPFEADGPLLPDAGDAEKYLRK